MPQLDLGWQRAHHCRDIGTILRNTATNTTERNLGNMDKKRFQQALVNAFPALNLSMALLEAISLNYPTGVPDSFTGVYPGVAWKSFVNDLNGVQPATPRQSMVEGLRDVCVRLRTHIADRQFDLGLTFWGALRAGRERTLGFMEKSLFKSTLSNAFAQLPEGMTAQVIDDICLVWRFGDPDPYGGYQCVAWKKFVADLMELEPATLPDRPMFSEELGLNRLTRELYDELTVLRRHAMSKQLDMTDAFEEQCGPGRERTMGYMDKTQFCGVMSNLFGFGALKRQVLVDICLVYGHGEPDLQRGGFTNIRWRQFAIAFDLIEPAEPEGVRPMPRWMADEMRFLRRCAISRRLDMTDSFEEQCGPGREKNLGMMDRTQFISTLGMLFPGAELKPGVVEELCESYGVGDRDPRHGGFRLVRWKQFAVDFDDVVPTPTPSDSPPLPAWLQKELLLLRKYAINKRLDLSDAFEEQCEPGLEKNLGVMDQTQFCCTMGVLFAGSVKYEVLEGVCKAYAATSDGPQKARPPVRFKRFAHDFDDMVPTPEEVGSLAEQLPEWLTDELRILRRIAVEKRLDLSNAFEDQWAGPSREKLLGVMDKTQFLSVMGILFAGAQKMRVLQAVCDTYGAGDIDRRNGGRQLVRWRQFSNDFDTIEPAPLTMPGMLVDP